MTGGELGCPAALSRFASSVDRHHHHHVPEPTPPFPTQPLVSTMPVTRASGLMTMPATSTKGGATLMSHIGSARKWGVMRWKGTSSTSSEVIVMLFFYSWSSEFLTSYVEMDSSCLSKSEICISFIDGIWGIWIHMAQTTSTSTGFFSNLKVKIRGRSNTILPQTKLPNENSKCEHNKNNNYPSAKNWRPHFTVVDRVGVMVQHRHLNFYGA